MQPHYTRFLQALRGESGDPVLFEPFVPVYLTEQLIWRRGAHLWNTIPTYLDTLLSLRERTYADIVIADMRGFGDELAEDMATEMATLATDSIRLVALCGTPRQLDAALSSSGVCAVGLYGWQDWLDAPVTLPMIAMGGDCADAVAHGFAGWFCPHGAEEMWDKWHDHIAIAGGLGCDWLRQGQPVEIHKRCEALFQRTQNSRYLVGSGGETTKEDYLSLISLLGIYRKYREIIVCYLNHQGPSLQPMEVCRLGQK